MPIMNAILELVEEGEFRLPDNTGGGSMEDIDHIHQSYISQT